MLKNIIKYGIFLSIFLFSFLSFSSIILAVNYGSGLYNSGLYSATIPSATVTPTAGTYTGTQSIILTTGGSNTIRYSTKATPADCMSGTLYTLPIQVSTSQTIYTLTCDTYGNSTPASFSYIISKKTQSISTGSSVVVRYNNLIVSGNTQAAEDLKKEFPNQFPTQVIPYTTPGITKSSSISAIIQTLKLTIPRMVNDEIKSLQEFLNSKGYESLIVDGVFGLKTMRTVILFQKDHNLVPDGIVGPKTRIVINSVK